MFGWFKIECEMKGLIMSRMLCVLVLLFLNVIHGSADSFSMQRLERGSLEISLGNASISNRILRSLSPSEASMSDHVGVFVEAHRVVKRNVGVHPVLDGRLTDGNADLNRNLTMNVTRNEDQEIRKARITVVSACSLSILSSAVFITFVYCRVRSRRRVTKVGPTDPGHADKETNTSNTTTLPS